MKIWLDTNPIDLSGRNECRECDECTVFSHSDQNVLFLAEDAVPSVRADTLHHAMSLYFQECVRERWLVSSPAGAGHVAVLDQQAFFLLEQFRTPTFLSEVMRVMEGYSTEKIERIVTLFCRLGFLCSPAFGSVEQLMPELQNLSAWLHVTNACNLRCSYCYIQKTTEHMTNATLRRAIDAVFRSAIKHGFKLVKLRYAGGEASLHMSHVIEAHDYAAQLAQDHGIALRASLLSNGVSLSQKAIDNLKSRDIGIMISLDGVGAHHDSQRMFINGQGSFKYVDCTINRLLNNHFPPSISVTVSRRNIPGLSDLFTYILERELHFRLNYYRDNEFSTQIHDLQFGEKQMIAAMHNAFGIIERHLPRRRLLGSLIDKANLGSPHQHTCGVGQSYLVIDQHGRIAKCHADIKRTVTTIDADDPLEVIRTEPNGVRGLTVDEKEGCRLCPWRYWCTGGCPLLTYRVTGRNDIKSPNCNIYQALFPEVLRLEGLRLLKYTPPLVL